MPISNVAGAPGKPPAMQSQQNLKDVAEELEATFLAVMLKSAGLGKSRDGMGGGVGEDQYSSLLADLQAREVAKAGGIGLAEHIFEALKDRQS